MTITNKCQGTVHTTQCATVPPSPQLQALLDKANDKRSFWTKAGNFFSGAWEGTKRVADASWNDPGNTAVGVAKGVGNLPSDLWNLAVLGSKYAGPIPQAMQADALNYAALQTYQRGDTATANALAGRASEMMQAGYASDIFEIKGDAQKGGSVLSMLVPVGAIAKGAGTAAKVVRGTKALDTAADAANAGKAVDAGADAARAGDVGADAARNADDVVGITKSEPGVAVVKLTPAQILARKAKLAEPKISKDIGDIAKQTGGKQEGLEFRLKNEDSLARKLADEPGKPINDSLRYTTVYESNQLAGGAEKTMTKLESLGYEKIAVKNTFEEGSRYMGVNTTFKSPDGQIFELQFHTPASFNVKQNLTHGLYQEFRLSTTTLSRRNELEQEMNRITNTIVIPPGIKTKVPNFP